MKQTYYLFEFIKELGTKTKIKCEACQAFYHFFCNKFDKFYNTGAQMLDFIYHVTLKSLRNISVFTIKSHDFVINKQHCYCCYYIEWKGLISWLSCLLSFVTFPNVSWST